MAGTVAANVAVYADWIGLAGPLRPLTVERIATWARDAEARGFEGAAAEGDWYEAEAELRERFSADDSGIESDSTSGGDATDIESTGE